MIYNPEIYKKAAKVVLKEKEFCCNAITIAKGEPHNFSSPEQFMFRKFFSPTVDYIHLVYFGDNSPPENQLQRTLALLFMERIMMDENKRNKKIQKIENSMRLEPR